MGGDEEQSPSSVEMAQRATTMYTDVCCSIHREEKLFSWFVNLYGSWAAVDQAGCSHVCLMMCVGEGCFVKLKIGHLWSGVDANRFLVL